jgi:hypothetical protein
MTRIRRRRERDENKTERPGNGEAFHLLFLSSEITPSSRCKRRANRSVSPDNSGTRRAFDLNHHRLKVAVVQGPEALDLVDKAKFPVPVQDSPDHGVDRFPAGTVGRKAGVCQIGRTATQVSRCGRRSTVRGRFGGVRL